MEARVWEQKLINQYGLGKGNKKHYIYYQCIEERGRLWRGDLLHDKIEIVLSMLSFSEENVKKICEYAKAEFRKATNCRTMALDVKRRDLEEVLAKIENLEQKALNDQIQPKTYKVWFAKYNGEKGALETEIASLKKADRRLVDRLNEALLILTNLRHLYIACSLEGQQMLLRKVFELGFTFDGVAVRTPSLNPALVDNYLRNKEKGLLLVEQPDDFLLKSWSCTA